MAVQQGIVKSLVQSGRRLITADELSNGLTVLDTTAALADTPAALADTPAVVGTIAAGTTPRDIAVDPTSRPRSSPTGNHANSKPSTSPNSHDARDCFRV